MAEEAEAAEEVKEEVKDEQPKEANEVEERARKMGWKPQEEYDGEPSKWVPAKEYVDRAPLYDEIKRLRRKVGDVENTINHLKQHHAKVEEATYARAIEDLKRAKVRALEEGDHAKVVDIDEEIVELKSNKPVAHETSKGPSEEFVRWVAENPWYNDDEELREAADTLGIGYASRYRDKTPADAMAYAAKKIRELYPHKFNARPKAVPQVEAGRTVPKKARNYTFDDLDEQQKSVAKMFERRGVMSTDDYIKDLVKTGQLK